MKRLILFLLLFVSGLNNSCLMAQSTINDAQLQDTSVCHSGFFKVDSINITGNKKTKSYIILREMPFSIGDSIWSEDLNKKLIAAHDLIYNTTLFSEVIILHEVSSTNQLKIEVQVKEKWYIYPTPQFQLVDRNINEWINVYNANMNRVIYGAKFAHYNFSGRRDQLRVYLLNGYARNFSVSYIAPYSNSALTEGFLFGVGFLQNREVAFKTNYQNKLQQFNNGAFVRNTFSANAGYIIRKGYYKSHIFNAGFTIVNVNDSILSNSYNPKYYGSTKSHKSYIDLAYGFRYANTNNIKYPLNGTIYGVSVMKRGLGFKGDVNMLMVDGFLYKYFDHKKNWYSSVQIYGKIKAPFDQPYINQRAFGYGELFLRGLENYVIDGAAASLLKYTLKKKVLSFNVKVPFKNKYVPFVPFTIYATSFADAGYSYNKQQYNTLLNNRLLYSGGVGIDILTLYDISMRIEYSFNQLNEKGLFLQIRGGF